MATINAIPEREGEYGHYLHRNTPSPHPLWRAEDNGRKASASSERGEVGQSFVANVFTGVHRSTFVCIEGHSILRKTNDTLDH